MAKQFEFADFVQEFYVPFDVITQAPPALQPNGQYSKGGETRTPSGGIVLPLSEDELRRQDNGGYTSKDRKVYTTEELPIGAVIERESGERFTIERAKDYSDYADVFIYYARGPAK